MMAAQERIEKMQLDLEAANADPENAPLSFPPVAMLVIYHDGPGVQFFDAQGKPMLPDMIRDVDTAVTLFNTLRSWFRRETAQSEGK